MSKTRTEYMRKWRAKNAEKNRAYQSEYHKKYTADPVHAEAARQRAKAWYAAHLELCRERGRLQGRARPRKGGFPVSEKHHKWKGDAAGYHAIHIWVTNHRGRPSKCELCGIETAKRFEWANKDHKYRRVLEDYFRTCTSCHRKHDYAHGLSKKGGPRPRA